METNDGIGGRTIGYDGKIIEDMVKGGNQGKRPRKGTLGQTGEHKKFHVPG